MGEDRYVIVGTAGHIDHGKTSLVQALTGKNTDRLKEEKERGISIDIDFAPLKYADGTLIGMVDVPGHERFVRNMVAGAAGIDAALLVIDVNEGMKPQTFEHISVLELLGVKKGVVAFTKVDLADAEWLEVAVEVIQEALATTVFADAPVVLTSTRTGQGIDVLKDVLKREAAQLSKRDATGAFRLPVDKVFSIPGFGTVVSGTVWRGNVSVGDTLDCLPGRRSVRVRGIQVHGQALPSVIAGQRAALNLTGIDKDEVRRGCVLAASGTLHETKLIDVHVQVLGQHDRSLNHRDRVHIHTGTAETIGRVLLLEEDELSPGTAGFAQVVLEKPLVCEGTDRFVLRTYSPVMTLGGGVIVDPKPTRVHRRKRGHVIQELALRHSESPQQRLVAIANAGTVLTVDEVVGELGVTEAQARSLLAAAVESNTVQALPGGWYGQRTVERLILAMEEALREAHAKRRFSRWVPRALVGSAVSRLPARDVDWLFAEGVVRGLWVLQNAHLHGAAHEVILTAEEQSIYQQVLDFLHTAGLNGIALAELAAKFPKRDRVAGALLGYAQEQHEAVEVEPGLWLAESVVGAAVQQIYTMYTSQGPFSVGSVRDSLGTSRKVAVGLLEYLDKVGVTRRQGDVRILI